MGFVVAWPLNHLEFNPYTVPLSASRDLVTSLKPSTVESPANPGWSLPDLFVPSHHASPARWQRWRRPGFKGLLSAMEENLQEPIGLYLADEQLGQLLGN